MIDFRCAPTIRPIPRPMSSRLPCHEGQKLRAAQDIDKGQHGCAGCGGESRVVCRARRRGAAALFNLTGGVPALSSTVLAVVTR